MNELNRGLYEGFAIQKSMVDQLFHFLPENKLEVYLIEYPFGKEKVPYNLGLNLD